MVAICLVFFKDAIYILQNYKTTKILKQQGCALTFPVYWVQINLENLPRADNLERESDQWEGVIAVCTN